mmetsp:Transcript_16267/g.30779  ORF Transcript_16267/g.30779 Transcript_16267/m.30779 type:complete len:593 (-) Transcript_16267:1113-2891(-)|eukprot:CAMPEP_0176487668 /NCGR_PEP_ID=MMETSP0200_2-20121128/6270_1 /TAXON_ID=947934 /ORGANISM="Chaetoceros sp., Strain GSL56" /LENGTH=592 /DNA_ID=CAMNT_0017884543 /DNA_START=150 /DNA_END=1928 /DNA_ORIENTATION=+
MWRSFNSCQMTLGSNLSPTSMRNCTAAAIALIATSQNYGSSSSSGSNNSSNDSKSQSIDANYDVGKTGNEIQSKTQMADGYKELKIWKQEKISLCESSSPPSAATTSPMGQETNPDHDIKMDSKQTNQDLTFRQRRLSIHNANFLHFKKKKNKKAKHQETSDGSNSETVMNNASRPINSNQRDCMYASEINQKEISDDIERQLDRVPNLNDVNSVNNNIHDTPTTKAPLFPSHQVGTYSCHGIEPHPVLVYEPAEYDTDITLFLRKMLGADSPHGRSRARISTISKKKINQDRAHVCIYPDVSVDGHGHSALFGTYDGHGERGELLSEYTMNAIYEKLYLHPSYMGIDGAQDIERAFHEVFCEIDEEVKQKQHLAPFHSGSTACVVLLQGNNTLWVANVGDSRAVLATKCPPGNQISVQQQQQQKGDPSSLCMESYHLKAVDLSKDQNVHDEVERERILSSGGFITVPEDSELPARVWLDDKCSKIGLAMSRSIGDHALKHVGVIAEPVVNSYALDHNDQFLIIATDGVWEFVSSSEAIVIVDNCFQKGMGASEACEELIKVAMSKWKEKEGDYRDDVSAIVVRLEGIWDHC